MAMTGDQIYGRPSFPRMSGGGWGEFVRRRLAEIAGGIFIALALAYLLSVLTAHESDPSFNRAIDGPTLNLMGPVGAFIGDFALQGLGLAAILFALAPAAWGWKLIRDRRLERWWLKITLLPFAALADRRRLRRDPVEHAVAVDRRHGRLQRPAAADRRRRQAGLEGLPRFHGRAAGAGL